jgi:transposase
LHPDTDPATSAGRRSRRYPSDTADTEWALIEPLLPRSACQTPAGGRPEKHTRRRIVDVIRYITDDGCKWRALPTEFPPWKTAYGFFTSFDGAPCEVVSNRKVSGCSAASPGRALMRAGDRGIGTDRPDRTPGLVIAQFPRIVHTICSTGRLARVQFRVAVPSRGQFLPLLDRYRK